MARSGRDWRGLACFDKACEGPVRWGTGQQCPAWRGWVRCGRGGSGSDGLGRLRRGLIRYGLGWLGVVRRASAWRGLGGHGTPSYRHGLVWRGRAGHASVWRGLPLGSVGLGPI